MKAVNEKKPINVLTEFIADWVNEFQGQAAPFDSFECLALNRLEQKDVERWVLNCNYTYFRFGEFLYMGNLLPESDDGLKTALGYLDRSAKSIKDSNPLNLRSKTRDGIVSELLKDWPPFTSGSRSKLEAAFRAVDGFGAGFASPRDLKKLEAFKKELEGDAKAFAQMACKNGRESVPLDMLKRLAAIFCMKQVNPLYSLTMWRDKRAVEELCERLCVAFQRNGFESPDGIGSYDSYIGLVRQSQACYLAALDQGVDDGGLKDLPVRKLDALLDSEFFKLESKPHSERIPAWLFWKAQLIWNVAICAILGPKEAVGYARPSRTSTLPTDDRDMQDRNDGLSGEVLLRRHYKDHRIVTIDKINLDGVETARVWKILGSFYDKNIMLPKLPCTAFADRDTAFVETQAFDAAGQMVEGAGDSRFHAAICSGVDAEGAPALLLFDLKSKNGTYVQRNAAGEGEGMRCFILGGNRDSLRAHAVEMGVAEDDIEVADALALKRGDLICLPGSCFEVL